jgi:antirestriction protein ArdC
MPTTPIETPYQVITDRILALLEQGTVLWQQPWDSAMGLPRNLFSQRSYRGINVWLLTAMGLPSPFWATFHQVKAAGGNIRKGARGVPVVFWKVYNHEDTETGETEKRFVLRQYTVFNAVQLDRIQRRAARRCRHPGDHHPRAPLHTHRAVCPSGPRHAAAPGDPPRAPAGVVHTRH